MSKLWRIIGRRVDCEGAIHTGMSFKEANRMSSGKKFDEMFDELFGDAQEFVPNPADIKEVEGEFATLDEDDVGDEDALDDVDCSEIPADTEVSEDDEVEAESVGVEDTPKKEGFGMSGLDGLVSPDEMKTLMENDGVAHSKFDGGSQ